MNHRGQDKDDRMSNEVFATFLKNGFPCKKNYDEWKKQNPEATNFCSLHNAFFYMIEYGDYGIVYWASKDGFVEIIRMLAKRGVNLNEAPPWLGECFGAAQSNHRIREMKALVESGAWVNFRKNWSIVPEIRNTVLEYGDLRPKKFSSTISQEFYNDLRMEMLNFLLKYGLIGTVSDKQIPGELFAVLNSDCCKTKSGLDRFLRIGKTTPISLQNLCIHTLVQTKTEAGRKALGSALFHPVISDDVFKYLVLHVSKFEGTALVFKAINSVPGNETKKKVVRERYAKDVAAFNIDYFEEYTDNLDVLAQVRAQKVMERFGELEKLNKLS